MFDWRDPNSTCCFVWADELSTTCSFDEGFIRRFFVFEINGVLKLTSLLHKHRLKYKQFVGPVGLWRVIFLLFVFSLPYIFWCSASPNAMYSQPAHVLSSSPVEVRENAKPVPHPPASLLFMLAPLAHTCLPCSMLMLACLAHTRPHMPLLVLTCATCPFLHALLSSYSLFILDFTNFQQERTISKIIMVKTIQQSR